MKRANAGTPPRWSTHRPTQIDLAKRKTSELDARHAAAMAIADALYAFAANAPVEHVDDDTQADLALHLRELIEDMHASAHAAIAGYKRAIGVEESEVANG